MAPHTLEGLLSGELRRDAGHQSRQPRTMHPCDPRVVGVLHSTLKRSASSGSPLLEASIARGTSHANCTVQEPVPEYVNGSSPSNALARREPSLATMCKLMWNRSSEPGVPPENDAATRT